MKKPIVILLHIAYWLLNVILLLFFARFLPHNGGLRTLGACLRFLYLAPLGPAALVPAIIGFYSFYTVLYSRFFAGKRFLSLALWGGAVCVGGALVTLFLLYRFWVPDLPERNGAGEITMMIVCLSLLTLVHGVIGLVVKGFITAYEDIQVKAEMELALVRSQISPHFLFNTLNNIDVLIEKDASKASAYLNKLSDILRFMLYETKTEKIPLSKELTYIEKYIDLQRIRTANPSYVSYVVNGETGSCMIEPMLFIPFVENAFKHEENRKMEDAIRIRFDVDKDHITFECENKYSRKARVEHGGLGKELIQKRLDLLYPRAHVLRVTDDNDVYKTTLILDTHVR